MRKCIEVLSRMIVVNKFSILNAASFQGSSAVKQNKKSQACPQLCVLIPQQMHETLRFDSVYFSQQYNKKHIPSCMFVLKTVVRFPRRIQARQCHAIRVESKPVTPDFHAFALELN
jgi:hypothetical protein